MNRSYNLITYRNIHINKESNKMTRLRLITLLVFLAVSVSSAYYGTVKMYPKGSTLDKKDWKILMSASFNKGKEQNYLTVKISKRSNKKSKTINIYRFYVKSSSFIGVSINWNKGDLLELSFYEKYSKAKESLGYMTLKFDSKLNKYKLIDFDKRYLTQKKETAMDKFRNKIKYGL